MATLKSDPSWTWNNIDHSSVATLLARCLPSTDHTNLEPFGHGDFYLAFKLGNQIVLVARHLVTAAAACPSTSVSYYARMPKIPSFSHGFKDVSRACYLYCRIAAVIFAINTIYPVSLKIYQQRLADDLFHSLLHLLSALFGAYAGWQANSMLPAKVFTWGIGVLYFGLGVYGWFTPGLFLNSILAIPLSMMDNIFHLLVSMPALIIVVFDLLSLDG